MEKSDAFEILASLDTIQNRVQGIQVNMHNLYVTIDGTKARVCDMANITDVELAMFYLGKLPKEKREQVVQNMNIKKG